MPYHDAEVDRLLTGWLERFSAQTITDREALTAELREVRERRWAIADQSWGRWRSRRRRSG
ncbi:hypothetical protein GCM10009609_16220 [Pseudonocardia aurantiaca]|uniref:IclR family transcriptional regulator C-terminal domain-containing protein n=1 Tax=Pseudonocardia aurantiaca TaxID=75290 RepID=A0ABW4FQE1_9PSEU